MYVHIYIHTHSYTGYNYIKEIQIQRCSDKRESPSHRKQGRRNQPKPCLIQDFHAAKAGLLLAKAGRKFK